MYHVAAINAVGQGPWSASISEYVQPIPMSEGVWSAERTPYYHSFPVNGGTYYIQWGDGIGGESNYNVEISAYWSSKNSRKGEDRGSTFFTSQYYGFAAPRAISAPENGYVILYYTANDGIRNHIFSVRYYK
jgi:hypothetical protein